MDVGKIAALIAELATVEHRVDELVEIHVIENGGRRNETELNELEFSEYKEEVEDITLRLMSCLPEAAAEAVQKHVFWPVDRCECGSFKFEYEDICNDCMEEIE